MFEILVSEDAENDLDNIWSWYEGQKLGLVRHSFLVLKRL
jgi:hypothetical protein